MESLAVVRKIPAVQESPSTSDFLEAGWGAKGSPRGREDLSRLYLRDVSELRILSRDEEQKIAREIEERRRDFAGKLFECPFALEEILTVVKGLEDRTLLPERTVAVRNPRRLRTLLRRASAALAAALARNRKIPGRGRGRLAEASVRALLELGFDVRLLIRIFRKSSALGRRYRMLAERMSDVGGGPDDPSDAALREEALDLQSRAGGSPQAVAHWIRDLELLLARYQESQATLVRANLRLVISVARKYRNRGVSFSDLVQEGNLGLLRAADRFEFGRGFKFATYAIWWIRRWVLKAVSEHGRPIRLPSHAALDLKRCQATIRQLTQECGRAPSMGLLAQRTRLSPSDLKILLATSRWPLSLDDPLGDGRPESIVDSMRDDRTPDPAAFSQRRSEGEKIHELVGRLSPREQEVLRTRFGLAGGPALTLDQTGRLLRVSGERIRQVERRALQKLKRHCLETGLAESAVEAPVPTAPSGGGRHPSLN